MRKQSNTDWIRLEEMQDSDIDFSNIPELGDDFFGRARLRGPTAQPTNDEEMGEVNNDD